jgi:hypothetical protein
MSGWMKIENLQVPMENAIEVVDLPVKNGDFPVRCVKVSECKDYICVLGQATG